MAENITIDIGTSSTVNRRIQEDGTLIKQVKEINSFNHNKNGNHAAIKGLSSASFFRLDPNYGPKSYDKTNIKLPLSQDLADSSPVSVFFRMSQIVNLRFWKNTFS